MTTFNEQRSGGARQLQDAYIVAAVRTPIGKAPRGALRFTRPDDLLVHALRHVVAQVPSLDPAAIEDAVIGCAMSGHDGRRGYLQHVVVLPAFRRRGIANALVERTLAALEALDIRKSHLEVLCTNVDGAAYWESRGWQRRDDITRYSFIRNAGANC